VCITEYWRTIGLTYPEAFLDIGADIFVRKASLEYHAPAVYDDELEICGRTARLGTTSLTFAVEMFRTGQSERALIAAELVYVCTDPSTRTPVPLPDPLRARIRAFETTPAHEPASHGAR
jgi:acyl-CoA thioester hydrolase